MPQLLEGKEFIPKSRRYPTWRCFGSCVSGNTPQPRNFSSPPVPGVVGGGWLSLWPHLNMSQPPSRSRRPSEQPDLCWSGRFPSPRGRQESRELGGSPPSPGTASGMCPGPGRPHRSGPVLTGRRLCRGLWVVFRCRSRDADAQSQGACTGLRGCRVAWLLGRAVTGTLPPGSQVLALRSLCPSLSLWSPLSTLPSGNARRVAVAAALGPGPGLWAPTQPQPHAPPASW